MRVCGCVRLHKLICYLAVIHSVAQAVLELTMKLGLALNCENHPASVRQWLRLGSENHHTTF